MYCGKCGSMIDNDAMFCDNCGAPTGKQPTPPPTPMAAPLEAVYQPTPTPMPQATPEAPAEPQPKNNKGLIIGLVAGGAALMTVFGAVLVLVLMFAVGGSYKNVAKKAAVAAAEADVVALNRYTAFDIERLMDDYIDYMVDEYSLDIEDVYENAEDQYDMEVNSMADLWKAAKASYNEELCDEYGDDYKITAKVLDARKISEYKVQSTIDDYADEFDLGRGFGDFEDYLCSDNIKKGYTVEVKLTIDGEYQTESEIVEFTVVKCGLSWKVLNVDMSDIL